MIYVKINNYKGNEFEGDWNEKFYESNLDDKTLFRVYINNRPYHITKEEKERILEKISTNKIDMDNYRIGIIKEEFSKLDKKAKELLLQYLSETI